MSLNFMSPNFRAGCPILNFAFFAKFRVGMLALFAK
jgi:hypothetical protein